MRARGFNRHLLFNRFYSSSTKTATKHVGRQKKSSSRHIFDRFLYAAATAGLAGYTYAVFKDNVRFPIVGQSVLNELGHSNDIDVIPYSQLHVVEDSVTSGRTAGYRVYMQNEQDKLEFYFYKQTFNRNDLIKELFFGALARQLIGYCSPSVFLIEVPDLGDVQKATFFFLSENVGDNEENPNIEQWATHSGVAKFIKVNPERLGVAIAFDMLFGKSDSKLANLAIVRDKDYCAHEGTVYSIDHESCMMMKPIFLADANNGLNFIGEFREKTITDHLVGIQTDGAIDMDDNPHQPLKSREAIKEQIGPILLQAIDADIQDGSVDAFYQAFLQLTEQDLDQVFNRFGGFFNEHERETLKADIQVRQQATQNHLLEKSLHQHKELFRDEIKNVQSPIGKNQ